MVRRPMNLYQPAILALLSDGQPHTVTEIVAVVGASIIPQQAVAAFNSMHNEGAPMRRKPLHVKVANGKRRIVLRALCAIREKNLACQFDDGGDGSYVITPAGMAAASTPVAWTPPGGIYDDIIRTALCLLKSQLESGRVAQPADWPWPAPMAFEIDRILCQLRPAENREDDAVDELADEFVDQPYDDPAESPNDD